MKKKIFILTITIAAVVISVIAYIRIIAPVVNDSNVYTLEIGEETGYKGVITIYDSIGEAAFKWYSSDEYIVSGALEPNAETFAVVTLSADGCKFRVFDLANPVLENGEYVCYENGSHATSETMYYEIGYLSRNRIFAVAAERVTIFDSSAKVFSEYEITDGYWTGYSAENGRLTLTQAKYSVGAGTGTVKFDGSQWFESSAADE
ncbi:MAG: hypothetical protein LBD85_05005 [Oscillospiraceae bacterium]|jgi:hypothetical protein|nr:hypothetical protein [Oscillospiraceae bacterium]